LESVRKTACAEPFLHGILANNLLADAGAAGRLRHIGVGIDGSVYHPLETPQVIEECFDQLLATASAIADPFEQSFFVMVQLPDLQPFDDVNKRVSRMAANIPFIRTNLSPLSFTDLPRELYTHAMLGVYELNRIELLRDAFIWAYERSAARYAAVRQSLGEPDPFRLKYRDALRAVVGEVVRGAMDRQPRRPTSQGGQRQMWKRPTGKSSGRSRRLSCWAFTRATSPATPSGQQNSPPGGRSGASKPEASAARALR
jgi:hypothetical protein